jgi:hypothetical protein
MRCTPSFSEILEARLERDRQPPTASRPGLWDDVAASAWLHATAADLGEEGFVDPARASQRNGTLGDPWGWCPPDPPRSRRRLDPAQRRSLAFFRELGERQLDSRATSTEVRSAYHRLALKLHPDRAAISAGSGGMAPGREAFLALRRHYDVLRQMTTDA